MLPNLRFEEMVENQQSVVQRNQARRPESIPHAT
jgi:hypothetical protein